MKLIRPVKYYIMIMMIISLCELSGVDKVKNIYPLDPSYSNLQKMHSELQTLANENPALVSLQNLGNTANGKNSLPVLHIRNGLERIPVLIIGQHHGNEVMGVEIALAFARSLTQNNAGANALLQKYSFWIVPTLNPDAWKIVTSGKYKGKRKNNTDTNHNGRLDMKKDGVDLNRNYPVFWNLDPLLSPKSPNYKGSAPASEAEIKAIIELAARVRFKYAFFYHSSVTGRYNEKIYLPWQDTRNKSANADFLIMRKLAGRYAAAVPKDYENGTYSVQAGNSSRLGNARNYLYQTYKTKAFDIEVCGVNKNGRGIEHPGAKMRAVIVRKNVHALTETLLLAD